MMLYTAVVSAAFVALANAQSAPDWNLIPKACATQCAQTIQASYVTIRPTLTRQVPLPEPVPGRHCHLRLLL